MNILLKTWFAAKSTFCGGLSETTQTPNTPQNNAEGSLQGSNPRVVGYNRYVQSNRIPATGHECSELMKSQLG